MTKPAVHFDLVVGDKQNEKTFYNQVFGWTFEGGDANNPESYERIAGLDSPSGGIKLPKEAPSKLILFIQVDNLDATRTKIVQAGGMVSGTMVHPKGGDYAWFKDPEGILMGIFQG